MEQKQNKRRIVSLTWNFLTKKKNWKEKVEESEKEQNQ